MDTVVAGKSDKYGFLIMRVVSLVVCFTLISVKAVAATVINPFPDAELVESTTDDQAGSHEVMLGPLKKIANVLSAEAQQHVRGTREIEIYLIRGEDRTNVVAEYYQQQLDSAGINRFRCVGRECGASNHWANAVFDERILYGSSEEQRYFVSEIGSQFVVIYVTRRATGKIYVYKEILTPNNSKTVRAERILASLRDRGRYVLPERFDAALLSEIATLLEANASLDLVVVGHIEKTRKRGLVASVEVSQGQADKLIAQLRALGVSEQRLTSMGVGYLAPDDRYPATRLELIAN
jgi:hypothetical protein